jgi:hypothetical protein
MNAKCSMFLLAALLVTGCFNPQGPPAAAATAEAGQEDEEDECLEDLDAMCACAEAAGMPCSVDDRNRYEDACGDADLRSDVGDCIDDALVCEDAVDQCMP